MPAWCLRRHADGAQRQAGQTSTRSFVQAVYGAPRPAARRARARAAARAAQRRAARLWVVNPDNDSVSVFDTATNARIAEIAVGSRAAQHRAARRTAACGSVNRDGASISVIDPAALAVSAHHRPAACLAARTAS
jgi:YVTN family beta-propeller protein